MVLSVPAVIVLWSLKFFFVFLFFNLGLNGLVNLSRLNLSYNQINDLTGERNNS